jgi:hypothetical protein
MSASATRKKLSNRASAFMVRIEGGARSP